MPPDGWTGSTVAGPLPIVQAFPGARRTLHVPFDDPPRLALGASSEEEALAHYRRVRDEIREFVAGLPQRLESAG